MARAFKLLIEAFCGQFTDVDEFEVFGTYDPSIASRAAASRQFHRSPEDVRGHAMASFAKAGINYESFADLVRDRTRSENTPVAQAMKMNAQKVAEKLEKDARLFERIDLCSHLKCNFLRQETFRRDFTRALNNDGLARNLMGLWSYIDEKMANLNGIIADDIEAVTETQLSAFAACVYVSLTGSVSIRQDMNDPLEQTPVARRSSLETFWRSAGQDAVAQLQEIIFFGPDVTSWSTHTEDARKSGALFAPLYRFNASQGARIGREDRAWCSADGHVPVVTSAKYVSRHQCEVFYEDKQWFIADVGPDGTGSTNGTLITPANPDEPPTMLSGERHPLHHGDLICVNPCRIAPGHYEAKNYTWKIGETGENYRFELVPQKTHAHKPRKA